MSENATNTTPPIDLVGTKGWAKIVHLASALGRPVGTLNSWASTRSGLLHKVTGKSGPMVCVATAVYLHETRPAPGPAEIIKRNGRDYKTISALCSEVACEHGLALREARKRMEGGAGATDFPPCFRVNDHVFCSASGFRRWAERHGYQGYTMDTLPVVILDDRDLDCRTFEGKAEPQAELSMEAEPESLPASHVCEQSDAEFLRAVVDDLLEIVSRLETRFVSRGPGQ